MALKPGKRHCMSNVNHNQLAKKILNDVGIACKDNEKNSGVFVDEKSRLRYLHETTLRIECSVSACFFKFTIFPISFSNAKWI